MLIGGISTGENDLAVANGEAVVSLGAAINLISRLIAAPMVVRSCVGFVRHVVDVSGSAMGLFFPAVVVAVVAVRRRHRSFRRRGAFTQFVRGYAIIFAFAACRLEISNAEHKTAVAFKKEYIIENQNQIPLLEKEGAPFCSEILFAGEPSPVGRSIGRTVSFPMEVFPFSSKCASTNVVSRPLLLPPLLLICLLLLSAATHLSALKEVNLKNPVVDVTPVPLAGFSSSRDIVSCERVLVAGLSRLKLWSYSSAYRVTLIPSAAIPERLHGKIHICSHK
nr:Meiosis arrest female protein [Ipomoea batatas]